MDPCFEPPCVPEPDEEDDCVTLYEECNYQGQNIRICNNTAFTDIDYEVKSVEVPAGKTVYLYNLPCFNGQSASFSADVECLDTVNF